jgi:tRNA dimethylallyltransferase
MMKAGLVNEVRALLALGYSPSLASLSGIGYRQVCQYLAGELYLATAVARAKTATHRLARQQYAWFRLDDGRIRWIDVSLDVPFEEATRLVESELGLRGRVAHGR